MTQEVTRAQLLIRQLEFDREARGRRLQELEGVAATSAGCSDTGSGGGTEDAPSTPKLEAAQPTGAPLSVVVALGLVRAPSPPKTGGVWRPTLRHKTADVLMVTTRPSAGARAKGAAGLWECPTSQSGGDASPATRSLPSTPDLSDASLEDAAGDASRTPPARALLQRPAPPQAPPVLAPPLLVPPPPARPAPTFHGAASELRQLAVPPPTRPALVLQDTVAPPTLPPVPAWPTGDVAGPRPRVQTPAVPAGHPCSVPQAAEWLQAPVFGPPWSPATPVAPPAPVPVHAPWTQPCLWYCVAFLGGINVRVDPSADGRRTGVVMPQGTVFPVAESLVGFDGRVYLRLADGSGWAFDDAALVPEDPSVMQVAGVCMADGSGFVSALPPEPAWAFCGRAEAPQSPEAFCVQDEGAFLPESGEALRECALQLPQAGELALPQQPSELKYLFDAYPLFPLEAANPFCAPQRDVTVNQLLSVLVPASESRQGSSAQPLAELPHIAPLSQGLLSAYALS